MIHLNIGSNLELKCGSRFENISQAINLLIDIKIEIMKVSNFYETPSYPNKSFPKYLNVGLKINYEKVFQTNNLDLTNQFLLSSDRKS